MLTERMRPDRSTAPLPAGSNRVQLDHVLQVAEHYRQWPVVGCVVDGTEWPLRYWCFAGGWAGYITGMGEVSIKLVGAGTEPAGLRLETVRDPAVYDFDPTGRLSLSQLAEAHRRRPEAALLLASIPEPHLNAYEVSTKVNSPRNNTPDILTALP